MHHNHHKTDSTNSRDNKEDVVTNLHTALRAVSDCLADWLNNTHLQVYEPNMTIVPHAPGDIPANPT